MKLTQEGFKREIEPHDRHVFLFSSIQQDEPLIFVVVALMIKCQKKLMMFFLRIEKF